MTTTVVTPTPDHSAIKAGQNAARASGGDARVGATLQVVGESPAETMDLGHIARFNTAPDGSMRAPSDYAEVIIAKA